MTDLTYHVFYIFSTQAAYGEMALFFHDVHGGDFIAVLWKPSAFKPQPFKVSQNSSIESIFPSLIPEITKGTKVRCCIYIVTNKGTKFCLP